MEALCQIKAEEPKDSWVPRRRRPVEDEPEKYPDYTVQNGASGLETGRSGLHPLEAVFGQGTKEENSTRIPRCTNRRTLGNP